MKRKLNVGDRFVVVKKPSGLNWSKDMDKFCGEVLTIEQLSLLGNFYSRKFVWCDDDNHIDWYETNKLYELPTPKKSELKSGDRVVYNNGGERLVLMETKTLHNTINGSKEILLTYFTEDLVRVNNSSVRVKEVYRDGVLIMQLQQKTPQQLEIEKIEEEMRKLADRLEALK